MPNQLRNCPAQMYTKHFGVELGKIPFYGQPGNYDGAYYFRKRNQS